MPTLKQERLFENDEFGRTRPGAKMYFYEAGTTTQKATYTDVALQHANPWPLVADGAGVFPQVFLGEGGYRIIYTDQDDVQFDDRDNINVAGDAILTTSDFYFEDIVDAKLGISINGSNIDLQIGQVVRTVGDNSIYDNGGAEWVVVAGGTGTADDDLYADLNNGLQLKRVFNQLYTNRNLGEIADAGATAQEEARDNIDTYGKDDVYTKTETFNKSLNLSDADDFGVLRINIDTYSKAETVSTIQTRLGVETTVFAGSSTSVDLDSVGGGYPGDGFYTVSYYNGSSNKDALIYCSSSDDVNSCDTDGTFWDVVRCSTSHVVSVTRYGSGAGSLTINTIRQIG
jgi:hypothetical protein